MHIVIIAPGSRGDVQPYIALGKGLKRAGNVVRLVTHQNFEVLVSSHGLEFWPVEGSVQDIAQSKQMRRADLPGSVLMVDSVPFSWLFPRVAAVVHHGGAGTTAAGLRAGVPSVVIPFFGDQPFWGQRMAELGVGPAPIPRRRLTIERLARAIQQAVTDQTMRQRAAHLGSKIQAEDGTARAVAVVQQIETGGAA